MLGRKTPMFIQRPVYRFGHDFDCSGIEINPTIPATLREFPSATPQSLQVIKSLCVFVGRPQLKNSNLWLKTGSCSALPESEENS